MTEDTGEVVPSINLSVREKPLGMMAGAGEKTKVLLAQANLTPDTFRLDNGNQIEAMSAKNLEVYKAEIEELLKEAPQAKARYTDERINRAAELLSRIPFTQWVSTENINSMLEQGARSYATAGKKGMSMMADIGRGLDQYVFMYYGGTPYIRNTAVLYSPKFLSRDPRNFLTKEDYLRLGLDMQNTSLLPLTNDDVLREYLSNLLTVKDFLDLHARLLAINCEQPEDFWMKYEDLDYWDDGISDRYFSKLHHSRYEHPQPHGKTPSEVKLWGMLRRLVYWEGKMKPFSKEEMKEAVIGVAQIGDSDGQDLEMVAKKHSVRFIKTPPVPLSQKGYYLPDTDAHPHVRKMIIQAVL